jgi:hypothetical protein
MGGHQSRNMRKDEWITPPYILQELGPFDLDPCAAVRQPWPTAFKSFNKHDDGLKQEWHGTVWLNPPYGNHVRDWMKRMAEHDNGIALIFARTETQMFHDYVWNKARSLFFFQGRLYFYHANGEIAQHNAGAPSVLIAYGANMSEHLARFAKTWNGKFIDL